MLFLDKMRRAPCRVGMHVFGLYVVAPVPNLVSNEPTSQLHQTGGLLEDSARAYNWNFSSSCERSFDLAEYIAHLYARCAAVSNPNCVTVTSGNGQQPREKHRSVILPSTRFEISKNRNTLTFNLINFNLQCPKKLGSEPGGMSKSTNPPWSPRVAFAHVQAASTATAMSR